MKQDMKPHAANQQENKEGAPPIKNDRENDSSEETLEKMKLFLNLLLKEIDKDEADDSQKQKL